MGGRLGRVQPEVRPRLGEGGGGGLRRAVGRVRPGEGRLRRAASRAAPQRARAREAAGSAPAARTLQAVAEIVESGSPDQRGLPGSGKPLSPGKRRSSAGRGAAEHTKSPVDQPALTASTSPPTLKSAIAAGVAGGLEAGMRRELPGGVPGRLLVPLSPPAAHARDPEDLASSMEKSARYNYGDDEIDPRRHATGSPPRSRPRSAMSDGGREVLDGILHD